MSNKPPKPLPEDADYDVGYRKPPVHTRFQPGRSGNPNGRPKGSQNMATALEHELNSRLTINEGGRQRTITKRDAIAKQLVNKSASGDPRLMQLLLTMTRDLDALGDGPPPPLSREADEQVKRALMKSLQDAMKKAGDE